MSDKIITAGTQNYTPASSNDPASFGGKTHDESHDYDQADGVGLTERGLAPIPTDQYIRRDDIENKGKVKLKPMSPLAASSTVVNLLLATGPFTYPYGYQNLGPILSNIIMVCCCFLSYISATWLVEAVSIANSCNTGRRRDSIFNEECYKTPQMRRKTNDKDADMKESPYYIRQKLELGIVADRIARPWVKYTIMAIFCVYMWAAMCVKYAAGAESLYQGISFIVYDDIDTLEEKCPWIYYVAIAIFGTLCLAFSFGDIENSKFLQIFSAIARIVTLLMMYFGSSYYLVTDGVQQAQVWNWKEQSQSLATVFGNTVFVFIYHHSIPGIIYPVRPQKGIGNMFLIANIIGAIALAIEGQLAFMAFSGLPNKCDDPAGTVFPCQVDPLFNENFQAIPIIGPICQFYPMLNVSAVPILTITLRNNFMQVVPVKRWIKKFGCCQFLLEDNRRDVKGIWSIIFSIPVIIIVLFVRNPQVLLTYTGGLCGTCILFLIPVTLVLYGRQSVQSRQEANPNASNFQHIGWVVIVLVFSAVTLTFVLLGIITGKAGE